MANTGDLFPGTGENNAGIGATAWTNPGNIVSDNTTDATCAAAASSQYLVARNFSFTSIPTNATINGVFMRVEASEHSTSTEALRAQLQDNNGSLVGSAKTTSDQGNIAGTTKDIYTYGSTSDLWGATLTPNILHDADFGVRVWFVTAHDVRIDYITLAVEYTLATYGLAEETNTALAPTIKRLLSVGRADETDTALACTIEIVGGATEIPVGRADEVDTAFANTLIKLVTTGRADETDTAFALTFTKLFGAARADETDTSITRTLTKLFATARADEVDASFALTFTKTFATARADEINTAFALTFTKTFGVSRADETDTAFALSFAGGQLQVGLSSETDTAFAPSLTKLLTTSQATETDTTFAPSLTKQLAVGRADETDVAVLRTWAKVFAAEHLAIETDTAFACTLTKRMAVGRANEIDQAFSLYSGGGEDVQYYCRVAHLSRLMARRRHAN